MVEQILYLMGFQEIKILVEVAVGEEHFDGAGTIRSEDGLVCLCYCFLTKLGKMVYGQVQFQVDEQPVLFLLDWELYQLKMEANWDCWDD